MNKSLSVFIFQKCIVEAVLKPSCQLKSPALQPLWFKQFIFSSNATVSVSLQYLLKFWGWFEFYLLCGYTVGVYRMKRQLQHILDFFFFYFGTAVLDWFFWLRICGSLGLLVTFLNSIFEQCSAACSLTFKMSLFCTVKFKKPKGQTFILPSGILNL